MKCSSTKRFTLVLAALMLLASSVASSASAEFGPIELISKSAKEQADLALGPALSEDGRFVAFAGHLGGREGIFRKDLQTGALTVVVELSAPGVREARPSISADGRYVAFTTKAALDPADDQQANSPDVYVADMGTAPPTYELVSALDGCVPGHSPESCGLTYVGEGGSVAAGRVAISADGRRVAFLTRAESNLGGVGTPAGQVAVRDLTSHRTYLMTVGEGTEEPVPGGGAATASEGAAISGDGTTVAWVGRRLPAQVPMLADEEQAIFAVEGEHPSSVQQEYHEPLWRRVPTQLEHHPPTRRVVGGGDPLAPGCPSGGTLADPACQGPFPDTARQRALERIGLEGEGWGIVVPRLSRDGSTVALVVNPDEGKDLYVVDMAPGLSRRQAVRRLTRWVNVAPESPFPVNWFGAPLLSADISECAISPDGNRIAFTTVRQVFPLIPPTLVTPRPATVGSPEMYQLDLSTETIERVTPGPGAEVSLGGLSGANSPSYDADGGRLAFASDAYNLVAGDTNEASDVFVVDSPPAAPVEQTKISPHPAQITVRPLWRMTVSAVSLHDGRVRVVVGVPGAGTVRVKGQARVGHRSKLRRVASARRQAGGAGVQRLILSLPRKLRGLAQRKGGLNAELDVAFAATAGKPLRSALDARFLVHTGRGKKR